MLKKLLLTLLIISPLSIMAKPVLTVYSTNSFASNWGPAPNIKQAFEDSCNCKVNIVSLNDGASLLTRLRMEGENSKADIILGLDNNQMAEAEECGLFAAHNLDTTLLKIPNGWDNTYFIPYDYGYFAFIYDKERVKTPPKSLRELIEQAKWKVIYSDPRTSSAGLGLMLWVEKVYGENSEQAWQQLAKHTITVPKGWSEAYNLFLKNEADLVLSYTTSPAYHMIDNKTQRYVAAKFSEGHYMQIEVAGQLKSSKHPKLAAKFMQFIITPAFQNHIPTKNWMYPVIDIELPPEFSKLITPPGTLEFTAKEVAEQRNNWIRSWQNATSR